MFKLTAELMHTQLKSTAQAGIWFSILVSLLCELDGKDIVQVGKADLCICLFEDISRVN